MRYRQGVLNTIARTVESVGVPVIVKEVGAGLSAEVASLLAGVGVRVIDVAGKGGTSWQRSKPGGPPVLPTVTLPDITLIASGGIRNGVDAAKAIRLGADLVGQAAGVLNEAMLSSSAVIEHFEIIIRQLRIACFCTASADLAALRKARLSLPLAINGSPP